MQILTNYDEMFMQKAISLAKKGWGRTGTNPLVGALIVKNNRIVGQGFHRKIGEAHAEVCALTDAGNRAKDATLYVNLEPCCCSGRTPPCVEAIHNARIKRVVVGMIDPNPEVNGNGIKYLKQNNIAVTLNVLPQKAMQLNLWYKKYITAKMPYTILKIAISKNGKISGFKEKYITSESSRRFVHSLRNQVSAVLVGINTVLSDNPYLTDRYTGRHNPARVVIDPHLKIPMDSNILKADSRRIIITNCTDTGDKITKLTGLGIEFLFLEGEHYRISRILEELSSMNIGSILVEGGGKVFSQFFNEKLYDEMYFFIAPREVEQGLAIAENILNEIQSKDLKSTQIGEDLLYHVYRNN